jgi:hypothetical protein
VGAWRPVFQSPAYGDHVKPRCDQLRGVGMAQAVKGGSQAEVVHEHRPFLRQRIGAAGVAVPGWEHEIVGGVTCPGQERSAAPAGPSSVPGVQ